MRSPYARAIAVTASSSNQLLDPHVYPGNHQDRPGGTNTMRKKLITRIAAGVAATGIAVTGTAIIAQPASAATANSCLQQLSPGWP
jgi:hypothetical protein